MGDENPIRTLGDYSRPNHEGYRNTIKLPDGNNVVSLRSDTIRLVQNGCSFHGLRSEDPNQHRKDFLKLMDSLDLDVANRERTRLRLFQFPIRDKASNWIEHLPARSISTWEDLTTRESLSEAWTRFKDLLQKVPHHGMDSWLQALLEDLALYDNESYNDPRDFAKPFKAISLPQDVPCTSDRRLIELKNQVQRLMEAHLAPKSPVQVNKITSSEQNQKSSSPKHVLFVNTITIIRKEDEPMEAGIIEPNETKNNDHNTIVEDEDKGQNFIGIGRDMHVFVGNMSHVMDFTILEKIKANIDPSLSHVVFDRPFVKITKLILDREQGLITFTDGIKKVTFKTPYRDSEMDDLTSDEHDLLSSRVILSEDYYRRGCERASNIESGFYMNVDKLGPSYKEETNILMRHLKLMEI
ncbi:hypothetical protein Tco_0067131 [Tanacetum coccineum]